MGASATSRWRHAIKTLVASKRGYAAAHAFDGIHRDTLKCEFKCKLIEDKETHDIHFARDKKIMLEKGLKKEDSECEICMNIYENLQNITE